jgi:hypothetical protein
MEILIYGVELKLQWKELIKNNFLKFFRFILFFTLLLYCNFSFLGAEDLKIEFIYVDSNTGQSSGGHTGLKIGQYIYHFQFFEDEIFHLVRENWNEFKYIYNSIDNRNIIKREFILTAENYETIRSYLNEFYLIQQKQLEILSYLKKDILYLESLKSNSSLSIPGLGYLTLTVDSKNKIFNLSPGESLLIKSQLTRINTSISEITYKEINNIKLSKIDYIFSQDIFSQNIEDLLQSKMGLSCIINKCEIDESSFIKIDSFIGSKDKNNILTKWKKNLPYLHQSIINQIKNNNDKSNKNLLISVLRFYYIQKSIESNSIYIPDCFNYNSNMIENINNEDIILEEYKKSIMILFKKGIENFLKNDIYSEEDFTYLEDSSNRMLEISSLHNKKNYIRINYNILYPSKEKDILIDEKLKVSDNLIDNIKRAKINFENFNIKMKNLYPFDLIRENCTTEIFTTLNRLTKNNQKESVDLLGGYIDSKNNFTFIPFIADFKVGYNYKTKTKEVVQSYRLRSKDQMKTHDLPIWIALKESNTISSSIYKFNSNDSFFIFFTDDTILLRPIMGSVNLIGGVGQFSLGMFTFPFDKGNNLKKGFEGSLFSLPELFFFNIRKGSFINSKEFQNIFFDENNN